METRQLIAMRCAVLVTFEVYIAADMPHTHEDQAPLDLLMRTTTTAVSTSVGNVTPPTFW